MPLPITNVNPLSLAVTCCGWARRIVAAVSLDASMVIELLTPLYPAYFLPMASIANAGEQHELYDNVVVFHLTFELSSI